MKAARIHRYGGPVVLEEVARPAPGEGDLLVQVKAASVNPVDFKIRDGKVKVLVRDRFPLTLGSDLSGVVVESRSEKFKPGDEIFARLDKDRIGSFAEVALVRDTAAALKPARLSHVEAASLPLVGLTSFQALVDLGHVQPGQRVLIHAGSGGVGTIAIQLAKHLGAWVATTVGARNAELVKRLGADQAIDYKAQRFDEELRDLDFVLDTQGGETLQRSFKTLRRGGTLVSVGGVPDAKFARAWGLNPLLVLALRFMSRKETALAAKHGVRYEYLFMRADGAELAQLAALVDQRKLQPVIDRTFKLDEIEEALAYSEAGRATGKVVVTV